MLRYKVIIEIKGTGRSISFVESGVEDTLNTVKNFLIENLDATLSPEEMACPDCAGMVDDPFYTCTTCWCEGGDGVLKFTPT